jgi:hypothetical protein
MQIGLRVVPAILSLGIAILTVNAAERPESVSLKSGESVDLGNVFWVVNCRSLLTGPIVAEVLEGPPEVTVTIREQKVIPRNLDCANEV